MSAPRPLATIGGSGAVETHKDSLATPPAAMVEEVFRELPLLYVRRNSRGEAEISARGSESRQVAVLVDGVPITLAWDARADVSMIPANAVQNVIFVRGLSSMLYGPNVLGGVIELDVGRGSAPLESHHAQVTLGVDDVGMVGSTVSTSWRCARGWGEWLVRGGMGYRRSPGDPLARGIVEPVPAGDGLRVNTDTENMNGFMALRLRTDGGAWVAVSGSSFLGTRGIAAELNVPDEDARFWRYPHVSRTLAVISGGTGLRDSPVGGQCGLETCVGFDQGRTDIDAFTSRDYRVVDAFENGKDHTLTLRLLADQTLGGHGDLHTAFTVSDIHHDESIPDGEFEYRQRLWSMGIETTWRLVESWGALNSFTLSAGGAYDASETPQAGGREPLSRLTGWGSRVGLSAVLGDGGSILHAGVSRRGRFPALRELYSGSLNRFVPNPELKPEELITTEAGVTMGRGNCEVQAVLFHHRLDDAVVRVTLEDRRFMRVNRDELRSTGIELLGSVAPGRVAVRANLVLQNVELTDTEAAQTNRPENLPEVFGGVVAHVPLPLCLKGVIGVHYTGEQFTLDRTTGGDARLPAQAILTAALSRTWPIAVSWVAGSFSSVEARCAVDNAGDAVLYDAAGLPQPGRRVRFEIQVR